MHSLHMFLESHYQAMKQNPSDCRKRLFMDRLELLLQSENEAIRKQSMLWLLESLQKHPPASAGLFKELLALAQPYSDAWLTQPLVQLYISAEQHHKPELLQWILSLPYEDTATRLPMIDNLLQHYIQQKPLDPALLEVLIRLDAIAGEVTELALFQFPGKTVEQNDRIIRLLGKTGRYRIVKPLIGFAAEYTEHLRTVMKAFSRLDYPEVDQFYLSCLEKPFRKRPMVLIEAIKQVRKRRLRKAIPQMEAIFPMEDTNAPVVNRALNGEIALAMASFGAYEWARDKLLPEIMLNGINQKYLKAIDMLNLQEAVPILKAILLMPDTPELSVVQEQAYQICERLLTTSRVGC